MSYFGFLLTFLVPPLVILIAWCCIDSRRGAKIPASLRGQPFWVALFAHVVVAVVYTTPWDNYLVATHIWWYEPERVIGVVLGWVPVEEYTFFVLQTFLTGLWWCWLARRLALPGEYAPGRPVVRWASMGAALLVWLGFVALWFSGWTAGTYLALEFMWALLPVMVQLGFGADILWYHRRLVLWTVLPPTIYLSVADSIAVDAGTWIFSPEKSTGWLLGGALPLEELMFFLLTNTLIGFGITLVTADASQQRFRGLVARSKAPLPLE